MGLMEGLRRLQNYPFEAKLKSEINSLLNKYGEVLNIKIDSVNNQISADVLLKGEKENIQIIVKDYSFGDDYLEFSEIIASREWIQLIIDNIVIPNYVPQKKYKLDPKLHLWRKL
ncbi:MAG: hypothetical protein AB9882_13345 [Ignavibacteriaceae bacterium]